MMIRNRTKNRVIAEKAEIADTFFSRLKGLLGRRELHQGEALVIEPCNSIHTVGMKFSIDALFLDDECRVVALRRDIRPYRFTRVFRRAKRVVELPVSTIEGSSTSIGDQIDIER
jgi:uncharacterized membrane protein (UPF0127 family)